MSINLLNYLHDGADFQSRAVLATLQSLLKDNDLGEPFHVARWANGREQGYIVTSVSSLIYSHQLNIVFYEHHSGDIVALEWKSKETGNMPTPKDLLDSMLYGDEFDEFSEHSYKVGHLEIQEMAQWVFDKFWVFHKGAH